MFHVKHIQESKMIVSRETIKIKFTQIILKLGVVKYLQGKKIVQEGCYVSRNRVFCG